MQWRWILQIRWWGGLWCGDTGGVDERVWHLYLGLNLSCIAYWPRNLSQVSQCLGASVSPSGNWVGGAPVAQSGPFLWRVEHWAWRESHYRWNVAVRLEVPLMGSGRQTQTPVAQRGGPGGWLGFRALSWGVS